MSPMGRPFVKQQPPEGDFLGVDEIIVAIEALSADDKLKLAAIEAIRRRGTGFAPGELLQEAVCRALMRERNCPRGVAFIAFLAMTMRSIASHDRKQRGRLESLGAAEGDVDPPATAPSPEDDLMQKQDAAAVQAIHGSFNDDPEAQLVLLGWQDCLRGAELREATSLDQGQIDYAIRRIRIRMRKAYPQGWMT
jgi:DNA-directed RNA polymerase specialized sigma24 family protein